MDLQQLKEKKDQILNELPADRHFRYEINWLLSKMDHNSWGSFEDICKDRMDERPYSERTAANKRYYLRGIYKKICPGDSPERRLIDCPCEDAGEMVRQSLGYRKLNTGYRDLLDAYVMLAEKEGKKRDTIVTHCSLTSCILRHFQECSAYRLEDVSEETVMSFFYADSRFEKQIRSYSYKEKVTVVFRTCMSDPAYHDRCKRILCMLPAFRYVRKNIEYLTENEAEMLRESIDSEKFTFKERAIMMLLFYTGMRSCDIASLKISDIDWDAETISIIQQKTAEPLTIVMLPAVGNAIYEYLCDKIPANPDSYLFHAEDGQHAPMPARAVRAVADKAYKTAGIRQNKGERKGTHLFRHHAATKLLGNGIQRPVISRTLGHTDPDSLQTYLHTDFKHLGELALSVENFPVPEEVWDI